MPQQEQRVALITGASRIGQTVARHLSRRGFRIALTWHQHRPRALAGRQRPAKNAAETRFFQVDLSDEKAPTRLVESVIKQFGRLDVLIHMASPYKPVPFRRISPAVWSEYMDSIARAGYLMSRAAAGRMIRAREGRIVFISDWTAASGRPRYKDFVPYYVAKKSLIALTEALALELAPHVLINAIAPGPILRPSSMTTSENARVLKNTPMGVWGGAEEIAKAVDFFIDTNFVTGECLRVDGGRHLY
ncbi:MAG TPA: SDR family oxidoreductase [Elusimicrobiota bacterium]|nr:SDR family oxidoreductase [Elusimicrobiota bacterium]